MKPVIIIGEACDGFSITIGDKRWTLNQEDPPGKKLAAVFKELGFEATVEEEF